MKNKEAADRLGCKAEWIKGGEDETVKRLYILFKRIKTDNQIPKQWQLTAEKSWSKEKGRAKKESKRDISGEYSFKNIWKCIKNTKWTQYWEHLTNANSRKKTKINNR